VKRFTTFTFSIICACSFSCDVALAHEENSKRRFVADEATAIEIAIGALNRKYDDVTGPYHATLKKGVWHVESTLHQIPGVIVFGGPARAYIRQADGKVLRLTHEE